jgi:putative MATE family efflux protein
MSYVSFDDNDVVIDPKSDTAESDVIVNGSLWFSIWYMTWPLFINMIAISVASFVDIWVAGKLGPDSQAAIGIAGQVWFFMIMLAVALSAGTNALVSRFWGARDTDNAVIAARQSLIFAILFGFVSALIGLLCARPLLAALGASPSVQELGWQYMKYDMLSQLPMTILWVSNSIFRAKGDARTPMIMMVLMMVMIIALDIGLCLWPFKIGIAGIGISWFLASSIGVAISYFWLKSSELGECVRIKAINFSSISMVWLKRLLAIGIPACLNDLSWVGNNFVLLLIFSHMKDPTYCQAAWSIGLRVEEMLCGFPMYALALAAATIVGQNLGANKPERAEEAGWKVAFIGVVMNGIIALALFFGAHFAATLMSNNAVVSSYTYECLKVIAFSEIFVAIWITLGGAMQGAGYTKAPMIATVICLALIRLPLSWYLGVVVGMGPTGVWYSIALSSVLVGLIVAYQFKKGNWKLQAV